MSDTKHAPDLDAWKTTRSDGSWETYWRAGFMVDGHPGIVVQSYCRNVTIALKKAEDAAEAHHRALVDVGVFVKVHAFTQRWRTRQRGNVEEFTAATMSTRIVLDPPTGMTPAEAIKRARQRPTRAQQLAAP